MRGGEDEAFEMAVELNDGDRPDYVSGDYMCLCPAHADATPSLAVRWSGRRLVYHCYAGCEFGAIAREVRGRGLDPITGSRLGEAREPRPERARVASQEDLFLASHVFEPTAEGWLEDRRAFESIPDGPGVARYVYRAPDGTPQMTVTRSMKPHKRKPGLHKMLVAVSPWRNTRTGRLDMPYRAAPAPRSPYGAQTIGRPGDVVLAAEGEKCRDALEGLCGGRVPVISTYGSTPYKSEFGVIAGRRLILFRDSDEPGVRYAERVGAEHKGPFDVVEAPAGACGRPDGWDVADWAEEPGATLGAWVEATTAQLEPEAAEAFAAAIGVREGPAKG